MALFAEGQLRQCYLYVGKTKFTVSRGSVGSSMPTVGVHSPGKQPKKKKGLTCESKMGKGREDGNSMLGIYVHIQLKQNYGDNN